MPVQDAIKSALSNRYSLLITTLPPHPHTTSSTVDPCQPPSNMMLALAALLPAFIGSAAATQYFNTGVHCGTSADATLSDCQALVNDQGIWDAGKSSCQSTCSPSANPLAMAQTLMFSLDYWQCLLVLQRHFCRRHPRPCLQRRVSR